MPSFIVRKDGLLWDGKRYKRGDVIEIAEGNPRIEGLAIGGFITYNAGATAKEAPERAGTPREQPKQPQVALILPTEAKKPVTPRNSPKKRRSRKKSKK